MDNQLRYRGRINQLTGAFLDKRRSSWPPQHEVEQILDARNNQEGWRCIHCREWRRDWFKGPCTARIRAIRAAMKRRRLRRE